MSHSGPVSVSCARPSGIDRHDLIDTADCPYALLAVSHRKRSDSISLSISFGDDSLGYVEHVEGIDLPWAVTARIETIPWTRPAIKA